MEEGGREEEVLGGPEGDGPEAEPGLPGLGRKAIGRMTTLPLRLGTPPIGVMLGGPKLLCSPPNSTGPPPAFSPAPEPPPFILDRLHLLRESDSDADLTGTPAYIGCPTI